MTPATEARRWHSAYMALQELGRVRGFDIERAFLEIAIEGTETSPLNNAAIIIAWRRLNGVTFAHGIDVIQHLNAALPEDFKKEHVVCG